MQKPRILYPLTKEIMLCSSESRTITPGGNLDSYTEKFRVRILDQNFLNVIIL